MLTIVGSPGVTDEAIIGEAKSAIQAGIEAGQISKWALPERIDVLDSLGQSKSTGGAQALGTCHFDSSFVFVLNRAFSKVIPTTLCNLYQDS